MLFMPRMFLFYTVLLFLKREGRKKTEKICGASSQKPYNVGEKIFIFLADLNSQDSKL